MPEPLSGQPMEEVLASIRRIIADEPQASPVAAAPPEDEDVLELGAPPARTGDGLLSDVSAAATRQALAQLSGITIDPNADANSLDGLVREMLRPMLKAWLDRNLPEIVERLVAREIARVGGR